MNLVPPYVASNVLDQSVFQVLSLTGITVQLGDL